MLDGAELAQAIVAHPGDVEAALAAYESASFARSGPAYGQAWEVLELCLGDRAPFALVDFLTGGSG
ncbi:MAG: FAD-dependent monooxygenase, partial [Nocardia sp.]|nr:FAD-dependent monooxygenase [Nocardia sp.]